MSDHGSEFELYPERFSGEFEGRRRTPGLLNGRPPSSFKVKETREEIHHRLGQQVEMANFLAHDKPYDLVPRTSYPAAYLNVSISALTGRGSEHINFKARVDTGAEISCIPESQAKMLMPLLPGRPICVRAHDGTVKRARTHLVIISIHSYPDDDQLKSYRPERGVLLTNSDVGLIGMDIIGKHWKLTLDGTSQRFSVELV